MPWLFTNAPKKAEPWITLLVSRYQMKISSIRKKGITVVQGDKWLSFRCKKPFALDGHPALKNEENFYEAFLLGIFEKEIPVKHISWIKEKRQK